MPTTLRTSVAEGSFEEVLPEFDAHKRIVFNQATATIVNKSRILYE
jgi:hypothetical protein